jgi:hypothetical protein
MTESRTLLILPYIKELSLLPISNSEDRSGPSSVRVPARGLPPALVFRGCGVFAGSIFGLPTQEVGPSTPQPYVCFSHAPHLTASTAASPAPTRLWWNLRL